MADRRAVALIIVAFVVGAAIAALRLGTWVSWGAMIAIAIAFVAWAYLRSNSRPHNATPEGAPLRNAADPALYIFVEDDGSARELTPDEREFLATEFLPGDGGRPYIKGYYRQRAPFGHLRGFLARSDLPPGMLVQPAPPRTPDDPSTAM